MHWTKVGLTLTFWLTLRQYIAERLDRTSPQQSTSQTMRRSEAIFGSTSSNRINSKIINWIYLCLVKYWIYLSSGMLLLMSCQSPVVAYRIGYMILFLYFVTTFQVTYYAFSIKKIRLNITSSSIHSKILWSTDHLFAPSKYYSTTCWLIIFTQIIESFLVSLVSK